jgi:hypothetical protein
MVRHLLAGRVGVAVDGNGLDAQALQRDQHFFAQFTAAQQHDAGGVGGQRGSDGFHGDSARGWERPVIVARW